MVDDSKKMTSSRHNRTDMHEVAETLTVFKDLHKFKTDKNPRMEKRRGSG